MVEVEIGRGQAAINLISRTNPKSVSLARPSKSDGDDGAEDDDDASLASLV